jgi:hypothetical protein
LLPFEHLIKENGAEINESNIMIRIVFIPAILCCYIINRIT